VTVMTVAVHPPYPIVLERGLLDRLGVEMQKVGLGQRSPKVLVVSHPTIARHYGPRVLASLQTAGFEPYELRLPPGERYKTTATLQKIYDAALAHRLERSSAMVALSGGVAGDMTGFAAATWLRGIPLVQVPTSLLAMVDSAIGGKTGINHPRGKNLIGAFHQPRLVAIDPDVLATLPPREFRTALAEVIKYGVIWDAELFAQLETQPTLDRRLSPAVLEEIIYRCALAKAQVVSQDEKEGGLRAILNYGHTLGHAIEAVTQYRVFNHGEAVALGCLAAGYIAVELSLWSAAENQRQTALIRKAKLPTRLPPTLAAADLMAALQTDKKVEAGQVRFVLPKAIGQVTVVDRVSAATIERAIAHLQT